MFVFTDDDLKHTCLHPVLNAKQPLIDKMVLRGGGIRLDFRTDNRKLYLIQQINCRIHGQWM